MFGEMLREWRGIRGVSQMDLGLDAGVSARHVSFMESGRSRPSQDMVMRLAEALGLPLRERNAMLVSAGFAPRYGEGAERGAAMAEVQAAVRLILSSHPYPALAFDGAFDIVDANDAFRALTALAALPPDRRPNLAEIVFRPSPLRDAIVNWPEIAAYTVHRLRETQRVRGPSPRLQSLLEDGLRQPGVRQAAGRGVDVRNRAVVPVQLSLEGTVSSWITTLTTFGAPQDALVEELTIEQFHPMPP